MLDGEWVPAILATLAHGPQHFTEILTAIQTIGTGQPDPTRRLHDSILSRTLRRMEENGLITRDELTATFPKSTTYELTTWATALLSALIPAVLCTATRALPEADAVGVIATSRAC
ncbi:MAG: winged helix-turn-helix transcriptional regulator [Actinomycetota bacterium]|nr:winged helix-turn-helix transcriptional regulator [Actinomycetota bacterium]